MSVRSFPYRRCSLVLLLLLLSCNRQSATTATTEPPIVTVTNTVERDVTDFVDLTGRVAAPQSVDVRARVTGYLMTAPFTEGAEVKAGQVLFEIDPRPYQAQLANAKASVGVAEAQLRLAAVENQRNKSIRKMNPSAVSDQALDKAQAAEDEAASSVAAAKAVLDNCELNLSFTKVTSPIDGHVSHYYLTPGNLVKQDSTLLTTVVSQDPMQVYFDLDEPTMLRVTRNLRERNGTPRPLSERQVAVMMGLADEQRYPHTGYVDFAENQVDASTGTISMRGVFENPASNSGIRLLRPGLFVRIRMPLSRPYKGLLVPDAALGSDQGSKYLLTVNSENIVQSVTVEAGALQTDGLRAISSGLKGGERVIVGGLQVARPRMKVQTEEAGKSAAGSAS